MLKNCLKVFSVGRAIHLQRVTSVIILNRRGMCAATKKIPEDFKEVVEGSAKILYENANNVFYNNVQEFNRDITIAVITEFVKEHLKKKGLEAVEYRKDNINVVTVGASGEIEDQSTAVKKFYPGEKCEDGITILEALSATGLRSIRLANEVPGIKKIVANDLSANAVAAIHRNVDYNEVGDVVEPNEDDACILMYNHKSGRKEAFDVVDIDPYGSAVPFLDAAVQAVKPQGLLCVTCTDMAVLTGVTPETCYAKYRSMPLKTKACHEQALRILLNSIEQNANKYGRYIEPLISISIDFYVRVFVRVHYGQAKVKYSASKQAHVVRCGGCTSFYLYPVGEYLQTEKGGVKHTAGTAPSVGRKCDLCGCKHHIGGPIWAASMHNPEFVQSVLQSITSFPERFQTSDRMKGILTMISEELHDVPLYYVTDELTSVIKCNAPQEVTLRSAIMNAGYRVSSFHGLKSSIKTDAPNNVIWDILKAWFNSQNVNIKRIKDGSPAVALLNRESTTENVDFSKRKDAEPDSKRKGVVRFPTLPSNWGPKAKAKDNSDDETEMTDFLREKSKRLQGKRKIQNLSNDDSNKRGKKK